MAEEFDTRYDHKATEGKIYRLWEESGYFNPDKISYQQEAGSYCIIMPPPNANGSLHIGHAVGITLEDIMVRFARMRGKRALWLPGADHAGFETQVVFDKKIDKEGRNRFTMDREELWKEIWDFTQENKKTMENQLRKLGASCDWSREKFTLDPDMIKIVYDTFEKLYEDRLVYRDLRVINWCPKHKTALSDLEVKYVEREDLLYYIKYGPLTLATVRPETKFGDTALAVNPKDKRYKKYIGKEIEATGVLGPLKFKVIADNAIDPKFGTGVVKVTPAHDPADFEIWQKHKDEIPGPKIVIDESGRLTGNVGEFKGLKVLEAREKVAAKMKEIGILEKVDPHYTHQVATCYKCGNTLEPLPRPQWFVKAKPLAEPAIKAATSGKIKIIPKKSEKVYLHWLKNIRDWNISRQILWGIRIPAWYCKEDLGSFTVSEGSWAKTIEEGYFFTLFSKPCVVGIERPVQCPRCGKNDLVQDPDVFDTWFSSAQWPFATLMSSSNSKLKTQNLKPSNDFKTFYPTDVMETGYDILFFWVARMVMMGLYRTGKIPFKTVYLHGLLRDKDRQKMSKSKGNVIDPLGVAEEYGTDAVRMALVVGNTPGNDIVISEDKIRGYRNFATKLWNIARFILANKPAASDQRLTVSKNKTDQKNLSELKKIKTKITKHIEKFEFHLAAETLYHYIWHTFADKIIESSKERLQGEAFASGAAMQPRKFSADHLAAYHTLETILLETLKMLHPFMPFVTEEIYQKFSSAKARQKMKKDKPPELLMIQKW